MTNQTIRVALLAREGEARSQLNRALEDLGADIVVAGDPSELEPQTVVTLKPQVVLVSLDARNEDSIDRFDDLLADPDVAVMFDDSDVTSQLTGWDLNRWARHLAAKLIGSEILPPRPEGSSAPDDDVRLDPGAPETPQQVHAAASFEPHALEMETHADDVPVDEALNLARAEPRVEMVQSGAISESIEIDAGAFERETEFERDSIVTERSSDFAGSIDASEETIDTESEYLEEIELADIDVTGSDTDAAAFDASDDMQDMEFEGSTEFDAGQNVELISIDGESTHDQEVLDAISLEGSDETEAEEWSGSEDDLKFDIQSVELSSSSDEDASSLTSEMDDEVARLAAQMESLGTEDTSTSKERDELADFDIDFDPSDRAETPSVPSSAAEAPKPSEPAKKFTASELSLSGDDEDVEPAKPAPATSPVVADRLGSLGNSLELVPLEPEAAHPEVANSEVAEAMDYFAAAAANAGAGDSQKATQESGETEDAVDDVAQAGQSLVVLVAGIGGPDAVRQLLRSLPGEMGGQVLLYQQLEGGKLQRLVDQLYKISKLPVYLAEVGAKARHGGVAVVPPNLGLAAGSDEFSEIESLQSMLSALPAQAQKLVLMSGAAIEVAEVALQLRAQGSEIYCQDPEACFEPTASKLLVDAGVVALAPAEMATQLATNHGAV